MDTIACDHHGKRWARSRFEGAELLKWRYTAFNAAGQSGIAINTESCSMYDVALVAAHRAQRRAAYYWGHGSPCIATCDNPAKDGRGLVAAVWAGDGKPECLFPGTTVLVETEAQCNAACAYLAGFEMLGCDVENVAYLDGSGTNSDQAAIVQLCGDERRCFIFEVHKWPSSYASFATLMADSSVKKVANNWSGDVARILKRFAARDGAPTRGQPFSDIGGRVELADTVSHLNLKSKSLENMVSAVLGQYLDKAVDHRCWEALVLSPRHIEYAAADAWAHLRGWRVAPTKTAADMAVDDGLLGAAPLDPVEEDGDGAPSLSEEENEESEAEMDDDESEPAEQPRTSAYRHQRRSQPGRRRPRGGVRLVVGGGVAGFDPAIMAQVDGAVGSSVGDDDGAEEGDGPEDDADDGAPNGQSQARLCRS